MENKNLHLQRKKTCFSLLLLISKLKKHAKEYNLLSILSTTVVPERSSGRLWCTCANERPQYLLADTLPQSNIQGIKFMLDKSICFLVPWQQTCSFLSSYRLLQSSWSKLWTILVMFSMSWWMWVQQSLLSALILVSTDSWEKYLALKLLNTPTCSPATC